MGIQFDEARVAFFKEAPEDIVKIVGQSRLWGGGRYTWVRRRHGRLALVKTADLLEASA